MDQQTGIGPREKAQYAAFMENFIVCAKARSPEAALDLPSISMEDKNFNMMSTEFLVVGKTSRGRTVFLSIRALVKTPDLHTWEPVLSVLDDEHNIQEIVNMTYVDLFHGEHALDGVESYWAGNLSDWEKYLVWLYFENIDTSLKAKMDNFALALVLNEPDSFVGRYGRRPLSSPPYTSMARFCNAYPDLQTLLEIWQAYNQHKIDFNLDDEDVAEVIRFACSKVLRDSFQPTTQVIRDANAQRPSGHNIDSTSVWRQAMFADAYDAQKTIAQRNVRKAEEAARSSSGLSFLSEDSE